MGVAEDWQTTIAAALEDRIEVGQVFNPRRNDWDPSWEQSINNPEFKGQVNWEIDQIDKAGVVYMHFDPATKSPISLLELGHLLAKQGLHRPIPQEIIVYCPEGFWRKGNVDIMCDRAMKLQEQHCGYVTVYLTADKETAQRLLIQRVISVHKIRSNFYGYFAHDSGTDSERERKIPLELRGLKIPKSFSLEKYLELKTKNLGQYSLEQYLKDRT